MSPFQDKIVMITGGAQGIGKGIAKYFLLHQAFVIIIDADKQAGKETQAEYQALGEITFAYADIANEKSVQQVIKSILKKYKKIHFLINNAGKMIEKSIEKLTLNEWHSVIETNLTGTFLISKYALPALRKTKGSIVNIASTRALMSEPHTEAYAASKGGIVAFTHALALSAGPHIRVNCISPGWIETAEWKKSSKRHRAKHRKEDLAQHPVGRIGKPEDIAACVGYLCSPEATFITGANFVIDGGMTRKMIYV